MAEERERRAGILLAIARVAIEDPVAESHGGGWNEPWLRERGASFVTLRTGGELRGCIGSVDARRALGDDVAQNAIAAAYRDPRFPPLERPELAVLEVEVSVLSRREPLQAATESEAVSRLRPGIDGVFLEFQERHATFLPQVWEAIPDSMQFLTELRRKAGLPDRFWHPQLRISRYTVDKYR